MFNLSNEFFGEFNSIRVNGDAVDTALNEEFAEFRIYAGSLTADGNGFAVFVSNVDEVTNCTFNSKVTFIVNVGYGIVVTVATQYEHGQVIGADGVTINIFIELVSQDDVSRNFCHQPNFEVFATSKTAASHDVNYFFTFFYVTAERNHYMEVFQAEFFANFTNSEAFQFESVDVFGIIVTRSTAPAEECGRFVRFEFVATFEVTIFAGFEIAEAEGRGCKWSR